jgi:hypothetical protein
VYTRNLHGPLETRLLHTILNGERLFLHGAGLGVGASTFVTDYARAFNLMCKGRGDPRRIAHLSLVTGTTNVRRFLEALCNAVQAPITDSEARLSSTLTLGKRIIAQAERKRICTFVIDHVNHASDGIRSVIGDLMMATDPSYSVPLEIDDDEPARRRISIILVDHVSPEALFQHQPEVLCLLQGAYVVLPPITTLEDLGDLIRQADIGLDDLDLSDAEDREIAKLVLTSSQGLMSNVAALLRLVDLFSMVHGGYRPDLALVNAVLPYHRAMLRLLTGRDEQGGTAYRTVSAAVPRTAGKQLLEKAVPAGREDGGKKLNRRGSAATREKVLKVKARGRKTAEAEGRDIRRKGFSNLPDIPR